MINMQTLKQFPALLVLLTLVSGTGAGPVYQWVDRNGITWFSDTPPPDAFVGVNLIEDLPPPAAGTRVDDDFYSVINQARRMETQRLLSEKLRAERLQAEAEASRAQAEALAAQQPVIQYESQPGLYAYPYYPRYHHHRPGRHPEHKPGRPGRPAHYNRGITIKPPPLSPALRLSPIGRHATRPESHRVHRN
jgi:hypothetical protein